MKISEQWLREWVSPSGGTAELVHQLTMQGLEVDDVSPVGEAVAGVVVGRVDEVTPHPDADRLRVCRVDAGTGTLLQIVCGAPNVRAGGRYPAALPGAVLPGGTKIRPAKLRGVPSEGMLCSAVELGLGETADGLLELDASAVPGTPVTTVLGLGDQVLDINVTPNRADCFSVLGIARDLAASTEAALMAATAESAPVTAATIFPVSVQAPEACPRFATRTIHNVDSAAVTPLWMRERLRRSGIRPVSAIVDVTNYVMLELGQPLHAYDADRIAGGLVVRWAAPEERLHLLTGADVELATDVLVIADGRGPLGMAGIMGGEGSGVSATTRHVLLESAWFRPSAVAGRARRFGLHTEAATRFERGVDAEGQVRALERATRLFTAITGGEPGPVVRTDAVRTDGQSAGTGPVRLRRDRLARLLDLDLPRRTVTGILGRLGMAVVEDAEGWLVNPPSWRFDISVEADLIEEVARIHGYGAIPERPGEVQIRLPERPIAELAYAGVRAALVGRGYQEAITYSFTRPDLDAELATGPAAVPLVNPISADLAVLRRSLWPGLVAAVQHNRARQQARVRLFECGTRFRGQAHDLEETTVVAGIATGMADPEQWGLPARAVDFFDVKGDLEALLATAGSNVRFDFVAAEHPALHPGRTARIHRDGQPVGWLGAVHPSRTAKLGLPAETLLFEIESEALRPRPPAYAPVSRFPAVRRDLAIVLRRDLALARVLGVVRETAGARLQELLVFDVYAGEGIDAGEKSIALGLILQETSRTLTDTDVDGIISGVVDRLASEFNARIRE